MSRQVIWEAQAIDQAAGFLHNDPDGVREMLDVVAGLVDDPRPVGSFPYGSPDRRRLRVGRYRVMYDITAETVSVWHLGRSWAGSLSKGIPTFRTSTQVDPSETGRTRTHDRRIMRTTAPCTHAR